MTRTVLFVAGAVALTGAAWQIAPSWASREKSAAQTAPARARTADERQRQLIKENLDKPADPLLAKRFAEVNAKHFANALTTLPIVWEPRLSEVGELAGRAFTLLGVFGQFGDRSIILLHPSLKDDAPGLDRALCHEMIHAYLYALGDAGANHGPEFLAVLHRLSNEGAFVGIEATPQERTRLREWIAIESTRLEAERQALDKLAPELEAERVAVQQAMDDLNARGSAARGGGAGGPTADDVGAFKARRDAYNEGAALMNRRGLEFRVAQEEYNRQVARYNLMVSYPDGLDDPTVAPRKGGG